jgi:hypothetical protein
LLKAGFHISTIRMFNQDNALELRYDSAAFNKSALLIEIRSSPKGKEDKAAKPLI